MSTHPPAGLRPSCQRLQGKTAIVTGAAHGIGQAIAELFAHEGAAVLVADLEEAAGEAVAAGIRRAGGKAVFCRVDVDLEVDCQRAAELASQELGGVHVLVNNAAAFIHGHVEKVSRERWEKVLGVNVIGPAQCVKAVLPAMRRSGGGSIINIASVSGFIAQPDFVPYNSSKGAMLQFSKCLAMDLARDNIRSNAICPGTIRTRAVDGHIAHAGLDPAQAYREFAAESVFKRLGEPLEIAYGALFLASDESSFVTGAQLVIDGGRTID